MTKAKQEDNGSVQYRFFSVDAPRELSISVTQIIRFIVKNDLNMDELKGATAVACANTLNYNNIEKAAVKRFLVQLGFENKELSNFLGVFVSWMAEDSLENEDVLKRNQAGDFFYSISDPR